MTETTETAIPKDFLGINPTEINKKLISWGISLDEVVQKLASLGLPGIIFIIAPVLPIGSKGETQQKL